MNSMLWLNGEIQATAELLFIPRAEIYLRLDVYLKPVNGFKVEDCKIASLSLAGCFPQTNFWTVFVLYSFGRMTLRRIDLLSAENMFKTEYQICWEVRRVYPQGLRFYLIQYTQTVK